MQIALSRERFTYYCYFYATVFPLLFVNAIRNKNPAYIGPLIPLTFILGFQYDMCYGNMMERARATADSLITEDPYKFYLPEHSGIVSVAEYEQILGIKGRGLGG